MMPGRLAGRASMAGKGIIFLVPFPPTLDHLHTHANADNFPVSIEWSFARATMSRYPHHDTLLRT